MSKKHIYKIGDVVQLRSGGPEMTVNSIPDGAYHDYYRCQWFAGKKLESGQFQEEQLLRVEIKKE